MAQKRSNPNHKKAVIIWLIPVMLIAIGFWALGAYEQIADHALLAARLLLFTYIIGIFIGFILSLPCLIWGIVVWQKKLPQGDAPQPIDMNDREITADLWDSWFWYGLDSLSPTRNNHFSKHATVAWSNRLNQFILRPWDDTATPLQPITVPYSQIQHVYYFLNTMSVKIGGRTYHIMATTNNASAPEDLRTLADTGYYHVANQAAMAAGAVVFSRAHVYDLLQQLRTQGVKVKEPNVKAAIWAGFAIFIVAFCIIVFVFFVKN